MPTRVRWMTGAAVAALACGALLFLARGAADAPATADTAVIESYVRMAAEGQLLVGAYSRYQWHHPGPLYFYLLAPAYILGGTRTAALHAGAAMLSLASVGWIAAVCYRRRPALSASLSVALALFVWRAAEATTSPWNPHVAVLPVAALVVAAADVMAGAAFSLPVVALLASIAGQAHVALMPVSLVLGLLATLRGIAGAVRGSQQPRWLRSLVITTGVTAVCWALPAYEQLTAVPRGNVTELTTFFLHHTTAGQPLGVAVSAWSDMFVGVLRPDFYVAHGWPFVESPVTWAEWSSLAVLALLLISVWRSARSQDLFTCALAALLLVCASVGLWSATRIEETIFDHDVFWLSGVGALALAGALDAVLGAMWLRAPRMAVAFAQGALGVLALVALASSVTQVKAEASRKPSEEAQWAGALASDLTRFLDANHLTRPFVTIDQDSWGVVAGAFLELQKRGRLVSVEEDWVVMFTPLFRKTGAEDAIIHIAMPAEHARLEALGYPLISRHGPIAAHVEPLSAGSLPLRQAQ